MIKDHWLVVDGIQPCLPENVIPSEVKRRFQEQQHETQRAHGFGVPGIKREPMPEKRMSTQTFSMVQFVGNFEKFLEKNWRNSHKNEGNSSVFH